MKKILFSISWLVLLTGCVSTGNKPIAQASFKLDKEISWTASPPLGSPTTFYFSPGIYISNRRDSEGYYLIPPEGGFTLKRSDGKIFKGGGGVYLPDDPKKGINIFSYFNPYGQTAVSGMIINVNGSEEMLRMRVWGPPELVYAFKKIE